MKKLIIATLSVLLLSGCGTDAQPKKSTESHTTAAKPQPKPPAKPQLPFDASGITASKFHYVDTAQNVLMVDFEVTNHSNRDITVTEGALTTNLGDKLPINYRNSYAIEGGIVKAGETRQVVLQYFYDNTVAVSVSNVDTYQWVQPQLTYSFDGKTGAIATPKINLLH